MNDQLWMFVLSMLLFPTLLLSYFLYRHAFGTLSFRKLTPYSYAYWIALVLQALIAAYLMMWGARDHIGLTKVTGDWPYIQTVIASIIAVLLVPIAMILLARITGVNMSRFVDSYLRSPTVSVLDKPDGELFVVIAVWGVLMIGVAVYVLSENSALILILLTDSSIADIARARVGVIFAPWIQRILMNVVGGSFASLLVYVTYACVLTKSSPRWRWLLLLLLPSAIVIQASSLAKAPVAELILGMVFVRVAVLGFVRTRTLAIVGMILVGVLLGSYAVSQFDVVADVAGNGVLAGDNPIGRTVIGQAVGMPNYFEIFPDEHSFLEGSELQILSLFGGNPKTPARISMEIQHPESVTDQTIGVQNTFFAGAAYANFGWLGVIVGSLWVGVVLFFAQFLSFRARKTPLSVAVGIWVTYQFARGVSGGFMSEFTINTNVIGTLLLTASVYGTIAVLAATTRRRATPSGIARLASPGVQTQG